MNAPVAPEAIAVARLIKAQMSINGVAQTPIAHLLEISQPHLSRKLNGKTPFDLNEIFVVCEKLGIDPQETLVRGIRMAANTHPDGFSIIDAVNE